jgi:Ca2+-binding EF-hand superfamily protein
LKNRQRLREVFAERACKPGGIQALFDFIDTDRSGEISLKEFKVVLARMGLTYMLEDSEDLFKELDRDGSQEIDLKELHWFINQLKAPSKSRRWRRTKPIVPTAFSEAEERPEGMNGIQYLNHMRRQHASKAGPAAAVKPMASKRPPPKWVVKDQPEWEVTMPAANMLDKVKERDRPECGKRVVSRRQDKRKEAILRRDEWAHDAWTHGQSSTWTPVSPNTEPGGDDTISKREKRKQKWLLLGFYRKHAPSKANAFHVDALLRRLPTAKIEVGLLRKYGHSINLQVVDEEEGTGGTKQGDGRGPFGEGSEWSGQGSDDDEDEDDEEDGEGAAAAALAHRMAEEAMDKLLSAMMRLQMRPLDVFKAIDANHNSIINKQELIRGLHRIGCVHVTVADIGSMIKECDTDGDGKLDVQEWKDALTQHYHDRHHEQTSLHNAGPKPAPVEPPPLTLGEEFDALMVGEIGRIERWVDQKVVHGIGVDPMQAGDGALSAAQTALSAGDATTNAFAHAAVGGDEEDGEDDEDGEWEEAGEMSQEDQLQREQYLRRVRQEGSGSSGKGRQQLKDDVHRLVHLVEADAPDRDLEEGFGRRPSDEGWTGTACLGDRS